MKSRIIQFIDCVLLTVLGAFCFRYSLYDGRQFAEHFVRFPFLDFPVFIGEFLLAGCFVLFAVKWRLDGRRMNKWYWLIAVYFVFVFFKALTGYLHWGPLALRDAALFYYFAFAVFAYHAYRSDYFTPFTILFCYALLIAMFWAPGFNDFWYMGRICLAMVLALKFPDRRIGCMMAAGIIIFSPHHFFLETKRTVILANFLQISFMVVTSVYLLESDLRKKLSIAGLAVLACLGLYVFHFSGSVPARTIFDWSKTAEEFRKMDEDVRKYKLLRPERYSLVHEVRVYNPFTDKENEFSTSLSEGQIEQPWENNVLPAPILDNGVPVKDEKIGNALFRLFIWRDAFKEIQIHKPLFGFDFGKPFLSESLVAIKAGMSEWGRDGWISIHSAFINILFRAGLAGLIFIGAIIGILVYMTRIFIRVKSFSGLLLCSVIMAWFVMSNFAVILELPYGAIPLWTLSGLTLAYAHEQLKRSKHAHSDRP